ncbi:hypothetical protein EW145_g1492 [Phellinidium pouzarii]|uniref:Stress response RCI peptide n=1 Tax=Phellinidium pouzarii TaxID=167371 RepID=A0A4S4LEA7_9AGAM|nr:hypothetical protein EW145_g1492 [Phellinidium pouzarii]
MDNYALKSSKLDLTPRRHHGYSVVLFILGTLFPPLAVAARFGIGGDFWLNLLLTICGYIPGHVHNFYIQNVRNNKNNKRTPKWAQRYGLIDTAKIERNRKRSQWASRYNDRLPHSAYEGQPLAEGEVADHSGRPDSLLEPDARTRNGQGQFWSEEEERYYGKNSNGNTGHSTGSLDSGSVGGGSSRWRYPANFEDSLPSGEAIGDLDGGKKKKKKKSKKDRWARTEDAYSNPPEDRKRRSKKSKGRSTVGGADADGFDRRSTGTSVEDTSFPEDAEGGLYGSRRDAETVPDVLPVSSSGHPRDELDHEF